MPTNLAIDDKLIEEARLVGMHRTKKAVVSNILCKFFLFNFFKERQIFLYFSNRV